jgi:4a-hydroxytetrahydrobiopterin dehydratase
MLNIKEEFNSLTEGWELVEESKLRKVFEFKGFLKTMSFVNAVAWEANRIMHHPDMEVSFNKCVINITTHDEGNSLTNKDFSLAKNIEALFN